MIISKNKIKINKSIPSIFSLENSFDMSTLRESELNLLMNIIIKKNKGFDFFLWRKENGMRISYYPYKNIEELKPIVNIKQCIEYSFILECMENSRFSKETAIINIVKELIKVNNIYINWEGTLDSCFCQRINKYPYSKIFIHYRQYSREVLFFLFHEIGHAILNYYMEKHELMADREYEEYIAHYFEYCIMIDNNLCTHEEWINRAKVKVNYHLTETSYLNILYLNSNNKIYKKWESKKKLFEKCAKENYYLFYNESSIACPDLFKYPFDSFYSIEGLDRMIQNNFNMKKRMVEVIYEDIT